MTPTLSLGAAGALVVAALPAVQGSVDHPVPTSLLYLAEAPVATGPMVSRAVAPESDTSSTRTMAGEWLLVPGPGERWARSWVAEPPSGSTDAGTLLLYPGVEDLDAVDAEYERAGGAPDGELAPPRVRVVSAEGVGGRRRLGIALTRGLVGETVGILLPEGHDVELVGVGDASWTHRSPPVRSVTHWGRPSGGDLMMTLDVPAELEQVELSVIEHHLRPREVIGDYFFQRPDSLVPNRRVGSDRAIQRTMVRFRTVVPHPGDPAAPR